MWIGIRNKKSKSQKEINSKVDEKIEIKGKRVNVTPKINHGHSNFDANHKKILSKTKPFC